MNPLAHPREDLCRTLGVPLPELSPGGSFLGPTCLSGPSPQASAALSPVLLSSRSLGGWEHWAQSYRGSECETAACVWDTSNTVGGWRLAGLTELCVEDVLHTLRLKSHLAFCGSNVAPRGALKIADRLPIFKSVGPHSQGKWPEVSMGFPFRQGMGPPPGNQCLLLQTQPGLASSRTRSCLRSELQHPWMVNVRGRLESLEESRLPTPWGSPGRCWRRELGWADTGSCAFAPQCPFSDL